MLKLEEEKIEKQYQKMLKFVKKHNLKTNPLKTLREWAEIVVEKGHCPCDPSRPVCPCPQALEEIRRNGKCFCGKFFAKEKWEEIWGWVRDDLNFELEEWNK